MIVRFAALSRGGDEDKALRGIGGDTSPIVGRHVLSMQHIMNLSAKERHIGWSAI